MADPRLDRLLALTASALQSRPSGALAVALSGGGDSSALLHVLASLPIARARGLRAIHVDHGLTPESTRWTGHCAAFCGALEVPFESHRVEVIDVQGEGLEAAARRARYGAFATTLRAGECLLLAHHQEDQLETVLLKLLRGAGPDGLGGMRVERSFAAGVLWRPWLAVPREAIRDYLAARQLAHLDDPANRDPRHARNYLRHQLLPALRAHWPQAAASILASAAVCRHSADYLNRVAVAALDSLRRDDHLDARGWLALDDAIRALALEHWLGARGLPPPNGAQRSQIERQIALSDHDRMPLIGWRGAQVRLWRGGLYAMPPLPSVPTQWHAAWCGESLALPLGRLEYGATAAAAGGRFSHRLSDPLIVRLPTTGLRLQPAGHAHHRPLSELLRSHGAPPWLRPLWPLLYHGDTLLAVPGVCLTAAGIAHYANLEALPRWLHD
ncbi:MAG TPA: tRNA lysidine(34) synthetase TilS [Rhodanobacteraceae bacterium]|nr:tRNA lysidine(34) synthetase TilS [Rhodanobacteraceae bacterium]